MIWPHSKGDLDNFIAHANQLHPHIKFTSEESQVEINFLDVKVSLANGQKIVTDLYTKPTDSHMYLHPRSCHPKHFTRNIPYSQALRLRRICSEDESFKRRCDQLANHFAKRGYNPREVGEGIQKARGVARSDAIRYTKRVKSDRVPLVTTFHPHLPPVNHILRKHWPIIQSHGRLRKIFPSPPVISFRRPPSLRDILVRAAIPRSSDDVGTGTPGEIGCTKCSNVSCKTCKYVIATTTFTSHVTGVTFDIRRPTSCRSVNAIYVIQCNKCGIQYVGETGNEIRQRMNNHRSNIKHSVRHRDKPVAVHFSTNDHSVDDLRLIIIDHLGSGSKFRRLYKERFWIETLRTDRPLGLNIPSR